MTCVCTILLTSAPIRAASAPITSAYRQTVLYQGPGTTYLSSGILEPGVEVEIIERNRLGTWVHVQRLDTNPQTTDLDGWVISDYLTLGESDIHFSQIPENTHLSDAVPENVTSQSLAKLYSIPVIPLISPTVLEVYKRGQVIGNHPQAITKIGDSLSASPVYLSPMSRDDYDLGAYDYLEDTLLYYGASTAEESVAAKKGLSTLVVFDPMWATDPRCKGDESPLDCEIRLKQPSIAFVLFGPNDVLSMDADTYAGQMRLIVEVLLDAGVIPVLTTFSAHPEYEYWWQSVEFNLRLMTIADEYQVPLINLWAAARILPEYGLDEDRIHMQHSGFDNLKFSGGDPAWYGISLQNLLALRTLDEIRRTIATE